MLRFFSALTGLALAVAFAPAIAEAKDVTLVFGTAAQGGKILATRDEYSSRLGPFERQAKMKTDKDVSEEAYFDFVRTQVLEWPDDDKAALQAVFSDLTPRLNALGLSWPDTVPFFKTTGGEEGDAAYTRANAVFLPAKDVAKRETLRTLAAHELFHVLSRHNPALRQKLYAAIGYHPCGQVPYPSKLASLRITNPDAPKNEHCIRVGVDGQQAWVTPILFSKSEKYDMAKGGTFFNYLQFQFLRVNGDSATPPNPATFDDAKYQLVAPDKLTGFFEQIGRNTGYIIHPEETVADNFAIILLGKEGSPSPDVVKKIRDILEQAKGK